MREQLTPRQYEVLGMVEVDVDKRQGQSLRLKQQYFLVSATLQDICAKHKAKYGTLENFAHKHVLHINDTHTDVYKRQLLRGTLSPLDTEKVP